jgi:hypothetical protein
MGIYKRAGLTTQVHITKPAQGHKTQKHGTNTQRQNTKQT